jgi:hypothetical protein
VRLAVRKLAHVRALLILCGAPLLAATTARAEAQLGNPYGPLPVFELHSGFWINLHHTLYHEAKQRAEASSGPRSNSKSSAQLPKPLSVPKASYTAAEQRLWEDALAYYGANFIEKDLLFSTELILLKNQLGDFEDCDELSGKSRKTCDAGLSPKLAQILEAAAPVYRAHLWADHDRANRRWILRVAPLVREQGLGVSERLADVYQTRWPKAKIRVDVSAYANWAGAYTTVDPLRVTISSLDARNQDSAALEVLFHEASHGIAQPVEAAIIRECRQRDKAIPRDLWHALIFYTTGEIIRPVVAGTSPGDADDGTPGGGYVPYAVREGLYQRGWDDYLKLLQRFWQPYLEGRATFDDAIARMVSSL